MNERLTLKKAIESGRLDDFAAQAEAEGLGPVDPEELDSALRKVITSPAGSDPPSGSRVRGGSGGK
jgi:hypothetical protein